MAFDIGTRTGVLAAMLAQRGVVRILATDQDPRALACARENLARLGLAEQMEVMQVDLFPEGRAPLIVCNPPWIPARPSSPIENAIYDPGSRMLHGFINGLAAHLERGAKAGGCFRILPNTSASHRARSGADIALAPSGPLTALAVSPQSTRPTLYFIEGSGRDRHQGSECAT